MRCVIPPPALTAEDRRKMVARALSVCPDIDDDNAVVDHLHRIGLSITSIDRELGELIDEARASRLAALDAAKGAG